MLSHKSSPRLDLKLLTHSVPCALKELEFVEIWTGAAGSRKLGQKASDLVESFLLLLMIAFSFAGMLDAVLTAFPSLSEKMPRLRKSGPSSFGAVFQVVSTCGIEHEQSRAFQKIVLVMWLTVVAENEMFRIA